MKTKRYNIKRSMYANLVVLIFLFIALISCTKENFESFDYTLDFQLKEPAHLNQDLIEEMEFFINSGKYGKIQSIMLIHDGQNVFERYYNETDPETLIPLYRATPFVAAACVGIAIDKGYISNQDVPVLNYFSDIKTIENQSEKQQIHVHHLLSQSAGINSGMDWRDQDDAFYRILNSELIFQPGTQYLNDVGMAFLPGEIIQKATGYSVDSFANTFLFNPLGIDTSLWEKDAFQRIYTDGFYEGLWLNTHDMAKLGLLYLQNGWWGQKQLISQYWVQETVKPWMYMSSAYHQGYFCRVMNPSTTTPRLYESSVVNINGLSQNIWILDELNTVVVLTADRNASKDKLPEILTHYVLPAIFPGHKLEHNTSYTYTAKTLDSVTVDGFLSDWENIPELKPANPIRVRESISYLDYNPKIKIGWSRYRPTKIFIAAEIIDDVCTENSAQNDNLSIQLDLLNVGRTFQWVFNTNGVFYGDVANNENTVFEVQKATDRYFFEIEIDVWEGEPLIYDFKNFFIEPGTTIGLKVDCTDVDEIGELGITLGWSTDDEDDFLFNDYTRPALFGSVIFNE